MPYRRTAVVPVVAFVALAALSVSAQSPAAPRVPTRDEPVRFSAFAVQMQGGMSGIFDIVLERFSSDAERQALIALVETATDRPGGQRKLLDGLEDVKPRTGFIRTPNSI